MIKMGVSEAREIKGAFLFPLRIDDNAKFSISSLLK